VNNQHTYSYADAQANGDCYAAADSTFACMSPNTTQALTLLSVRIDNVTYGDAIARVKDFLREGGLHQIATVNPEFVVMAQSNPEFMRVLNSTALNVPDGVGLLWAAKRLRTPLQERVAGQELVDRICALRQATPCDA
jgi:N-acetylglucosaminyldiphosphoundecaprenol N-acetyl-beta-D-mannosaminyltransferase